MEKIDISNELVRFRDSLEEHKRLIFSAPFGDGKTYFLKEYEDKHKDKEVIIKLRPINYSVALNEDVFEYIKRDILCQLCKQGIITKENLIVILKSVVNKENIKRAAFVVFSLIPHIGDVIDRAKEVIDNAQEDTKSYLNYMSEFKQQRGGLYEEDAYTEMIRKALKDSGKESLLIIDDLDRLDPGHLFRILNVISAHIDDEETEDKADNGGDVRTNKFGFTYIVMSMDYKVTEHIFHHFYGEGANYAGYMHKFTTAMPFYYSITDIARKQLIKKLNNDIKGIDLNKFSLFMKKINSLTVRDCKDLIDMELKSMIKIRHYEVNDIDFDMLIFPLFPLLIYMNRLGMAKEEVILDFNVDKWNTEETPKFLNLLAPIILMMPNYSESTNIMREEYVNDNIRERHYYLTKNKDTISGIDQLLFYESGTWQESYKINIKNITKGMNDWLIKYGNYIDLMPWVTKREDEDQKVAPKTR